MKRRRPSNMQTQMGRRKTLFALALFIGAAAAAVVWRLSSDPVRLMVAAVGRQRVIEMRLSGEFEWGPLARRPGGLSMSALPGAQPRVRGQWSTLAAIALDPSADKRHEAAMAMLLTGDSQRALERFERLAAESPRDAQVWSDLAAARYEAGIATDDAALVAAALAAADAALRLDASLPQALFNRAVAIERLGIRDEARKAWTRFLAADGTTPWAAEVRERARHLAPIPFFIEDLRKQFSRLSTDSEAAQELARQRPQEARSHGDGQPVRAAADFEAGIAEVEKHRQSLPAGESRWGTFDPLAELFEEAVASAIQRRDAAAAFAYAERSRARELLETLGAAAPVTTPASFADGTALVEYFSLPDRLVVFAVSRGGLRMAEERVERTELEKEADAFRRALSAGSPEHRQLGQSLYRRLVAPVVGDGSGGGGVKCCPP